MSTQQGSNFVVRFIADLSRYNPAQRVQRENQAIAQSAQQLAGRLGAIRTATQAQAQVAAGVLQHSDPRTRNVLTQRQAELAQAYNRARGITPGAVAAPQAMAQQPQRPQHRQQAAQQPQPRGGVFTEPGPHAGRRIGAITALPAGPSALVSSAFGQRAGQLTDIGVVGGLLPEGLSAGAASVGVGVIAAGTALAALTKASIAASRSLGTVESLQLDRAMYGLRRQSRLLFAEIGQLLLPVLTSFTEGLTIAVRELRSFFQWAQLTEEQSDNPRDAFRIDERGNLIVSGATTLDTTSERPGTPFSRRYQQTTESGEYSHPQARRDNPFLGLQHGGIVLPQPGGVIAQLAEAGEAEAVIPLRQLAQMTGSRSGGMSSADRKELADSFQSALEQANALPPLWALHRQYDDQPEPPPTEPSVSYISGGGGAGGADNLQFVTKSAYDMLTDKSGIYAVYTA